jgi:hypothetical protein
MVEGWEMWKVEYSFVVWGKALAVKKGDNERKNRRGMNTQTNKEE